MSLAFDHLYINLRRSRDGWMFVCIISSLHSLRFGQLLRCVHKRIVDIMKVYIERNNKKDLVELIRIITNIDFIHVHVCGARGFPNQYIR